MPNDLVPALKVSRRPGGAPTRIRAAQYIRMSTDRQIYSTEGQAAAIAVYAVQRGIDIVQTYVDEGRSGLTLRKRAGLQQLLADVQAGITDYSLILVYDISRWGRFQDVDESAYYEFSCKRAGVAVAYCAELFENDSSPAAVIQKLMKRMMAGEYSRELSVKVRDAQMRLAAKGYRQGGPPGIGLRRMMIDRDGNRKGEIGFGEVKSFQSDRIILVPGPDSEIETVRFMFDALVNGRYSLHDIAGLLNRRGITTVAGMRWKAKSVRNILGNPKYAGHNRLGVKRRDLNRNGARMSTHPDDWVMARDAFEAIIAPDVFEAAQRLLARKRQRYSTTMMIDQLRALLAERGTLSQKIIREADIASATSISIRFGGLCGAYEALGFTPERDPAYIRTRRMVRALKQHLLDEMRASLITLGATVETLSNKDGLLLVNGAVTVGAMVSRRHPSPAGTPRWRVALHAHRPFDMVVVQLFDEEIAEVVDLFLIMGRTQRFRLSVTEEMRARFAACRHQTVDDLCGAIAVRR